jgi:hypothetical protein
MFILEKDPVLNKMHKGGATIIPGYIVRGDEGKTIVPAHIVRNDEHHYDGLIDPGGLSTNAGCVFDLGASLAGRVSRIVNGDMGPYIIGAPNTIGQQLALTVAKNADWRKPMHHLQCMIRSGVAFWPALEKSSFWAKGEHFVVVSDVLATGKTISAVIRLIQDSGGIVDYVAVLVDISNGAITAKDLGVKRIVSLTAATINSYSAAECPLCAAEVPIYRSVEGGEKFLRDNPDYTKSIG